MDVGVLGVLLSILLGILLSIVLHRSGSYMHLSNRLLRLPCQPPSRTTTSIVCPREETREPRMALFEAMTPNTGAVSLLELAVVASSLSFPVISCHTQGSATLSLPHISPQLAARALLQAASCKEWMSCLAAGERRCHSPPRGHRGELV